MSIFKPRVKKAQTNRKDVRVDLRSMKVANAYAKERGSKIAASKAVRFIKTFAIVSVISVVGIGVIGFVGLLAYSLKSGEKINILGQISGFIQKTPLKVFFKQDDTKGEKLQVVGVPDVTEYPGSTFVFSDYITRIGTGGFSVKDGSMQANDAQELYSFLTSGQSVYRMPVNETWQQVQNYYRQELPKQGWKFETSVSVSDTEQITGEYYTKGEKGLHVYSVSSDIWYETIAKEQAAQGLHDKIVSYKAKQELVAAASGKDLPIDAVWKLRYSRDWDVDLQRNLIYGVNNIYFSNSTTKERVTISVLNRYRDNIVDLTYKNLESVGSEFISTWLTTQQTTVTLQGFTKTERIVADGKALEYSDLKNHAHFLFLLNRKNSLYYVVQYVGKDNPEFFEYIKGNLKN